jgi:hypothetical protein
MNPDALRTALVAHQALIIFALARLIQYDPDFPQKAKKHFDTSLGKIFADHPEFQTTPKSDILHQVRMLLHSTLDHAAGTATGVLNQSPAPVRLTLRRRFLNWLLLG